MAKHTPGPWAQDDWGQIRQVNGDAVLFRGVTLAMANNDEIRANDRMASAAPELLEALQNMVEDFEGCYADSEPALIMARAAIAKATGQCLKGEE